MLLASSKWPLVSFAWDCSTDEAGGKACCMFWTAVKLCASARTAAASGLHEAPDLAMLTCTQEKREFFAQVADRGTGVLHQGSRSFFQETALFGH